MNKPTRPKQPEPPAHKFGRTAPRTPAPAPAPRVLQPKAAPAAQQKRPPAAPPAYRPQPAPKVLQKRPATPAPPARAAAQNLKPAPAAPPVYRPQPVPKVLQKKSVAGAQPRAVSGNRLPASPRPSPPAATTPNRPPHGVVQRTLSVSFRPQPPAAATPQFSAPRVASPTHGAPVRPQVASGAIQRTVNVKWTSGRWKITGRPNFKSHVIKRMVEKYNERNDTDHDYRDFSLTDEELDQCHIVPWATIRTNIVEEFINGDMNKEDFLRHTQGLYGEESDGVVLNEWLSMDTVRQRVINAVKKGVKHVNAEDVKDLCNWLNSATPNLRLDDKYANRRIKDRPDPHLEWTPKGQHITSTPNTYFNLQENWELMRSPLWSPGGSHFVNSSLGNVSPGRLTPNTSEVMGMDEDSDG